MITQFQTPDYLVVGDGRMAKHFCHYLQLLGLPFEKWSRKSSRPLGEAFANHERVVLLITDNAIVDFIQTNARDLEGKLLIHFSGCLVTPLAYGAHPLQTFGSDLYHRDDYLQIPFIIDDNAPPVSQLLPGLNNPTSRIATRQKPLYHSLCVMAGNFTTILWQKFFRDIQALGLPPEFGHGYLDQIAKNLHTDAEHALTGPIARNDLQTIAANINALSGDTFQEVYRAFVNATLGKVAANKISPPS